MNHNAYTTATVTLSLSVTKCLPPFIHSDVYFEYLMKEIYTEIKLH